MIALRSFNKCPVCDKPLQYKPSAPYDYWRRFCDRRPSIPVFEGSTWVGIQGDQPDHTFYEAWEAHDHRNHTYVVGGKTHYIRYKQGVYHLAIDFQRKWWKIPAIDMDFDPKNPQPVIEKMRLLEMFG